jgi:hypothetical protein
MTNPKNIYNEFIRANLDATAISRTETYVATLGMGGQEAISAMGLTPVPQDDLI